MEESKTRSEEEKIGLQQKIEEIRVERDNAQNEAENLKVQLHLCEDKSESVSNLLHETTRKLKEGNWPQWERQNILHGFYVQWKTAQNVCERS